MLARLDKTRMTEHRQYNELLGLICSVFESYSVVLLMPEPGGDSYRIEASFSLGDEVDTEALIAPGASLAGWVLRDQEPLLVNNVSQTQASLGYYKNNNDPSIKAFMACPLPATLRNPDGRKGALALDSKRQYYFSDKDQKILHLFAKITAHVIDAHTDSVAYGEVVSFYARMNQIHALRNRFSRWNVFLQHFLKILADATGFSYCFFVARDETGDKYFLEGESEPNLTLKIKENSFPMGSGLIGWIFKDGKPLFAGGSEAALGVPLLGKGAQVRNLQAVCCLPLNINKITRGVLCLAHDKPVAVSQEMKDFLVMASDHLALFLENLYLKSKLHQVKNQMPEG